MIINMFFKKMLILGEFLVKIFEICLAERVKVW